MINPSILGGRGGPRKWGAGGRGDIGAVDADDAGTSGRTVRASERT
ncbi:hypothetical protein [Actinomadura oligospora]|nr:hypothetical protein [Actinomadura oligospora]